MLPNGLSIIFLALCAAMFVRALFITNEDATEKEERIVKIVSFLLGVAIFIIDITFTLSY